MKNPFDNDADPIDDTAADYVLDNILSASGLPPNTVPLSALRSQANYRKGRFRIHRVICGIILLALLSLPFFTLHPTLVLVDTSNHASGSALMYTAQVASLFPVENVVATLNGRPISTIETGHKVYAIQPTENGELQVKVTLKSGQSATQKTDVTASDTTAPNITDHKVTDSTIVLYVHDDNSGVDWGGIIAMDAKEQTILPQSYDENAGTVTFAYPEQSINIYIKDKAGNSLQTLITIK